MEGSLCFAGRPWRFWGILFRPPAGRGLVRKGSQIRIAFRLVGILLYWLAVSDAAIAALPSQMSLSPPVSPCWAILQPFSLAITESTPPGQGYATVGTLEPHGTRWGRRRLNQRGPSAR